MHTVRKNSRGWPGLARVVRHLAEMRDVKSAQLPARTPAQEAGKQKYRGELIQISGDHLWHLNGLCKLFIKNAQLIALF